MKKPIRLLSLMAAITAIVSPASSIAEESISDAIKNGTASLNLRLRHENVDIDNATNDSAEALTILTRLTLESGVLHGFSALLEFDDVSSLRDDDYPTSAAIKNTGAYPGKAIIADPTGTEVNQAYISYTQSNTTAKYGRQRIILDNQRFVGGVGFRQNEQTYDGFSITNTSLADTNIFLAHVTNVNRIFGEDDPRVSDTDSSTELVNVKYSGIEAGDLVFYAYLIDDKDADSQLDTYGLRFSGNTGAFDYALEYATQDADFTGGANADTDYLLTEGSFTIQGIKLTLGYEQLGSDGGNYGFATPLATAHKFQGWSDQFLGTPSQGIEDIYFSVGGKFADIKLLVIYHEFQSDKNNASGQNDLGNEIGLLAAKSFGHYGLSLKYANYSAGDNSFAKADTDKLWLTATASF